MNSCAMCWFETGTTTGGPFMYQGVSLCARHLGMERPAAAETSSDARPPKKKAKSVKVKDDG